MRELAAIHLSSTIDSSLQAGQIYANIEKPALHRPDLIFSTLYVHLGFLKAGRWPAKG